MVHICFALHDPKGTYSKYVGVAMYSLLENTGSTVTIHLLHDGTVTEEIKKNLGTMVSGFHQRIAFYEIDTKEIEKYSDIVKHYTLGTLFRLYILELLPSEIEKIIYLDADLLIHMDIEKLWNIDMQGYSVAARMYAEPDYWMVCDGLVAKRQYFNAGVLVMDLKRIRETHNLLEETMDFFQKYPNPRFPDNDALNFIFRGNVLPLDSCYNSFTVHLRQKDHMLAPYIYHFAGDFINMEQPEEMDRLFFQYLGKTPWATYENLIHIFAPQLQRKGRQIEIYQKFVCKMIRNPNVKKIIFGASSVLRKDLFRFISLNAKTDYYIDNSSSLQGKTIDGVKVYPVESLLKETKGEFVVLIASQKYYADMRYQLEQYDLEENNDFFDARMLLTQNQGGYADYY